MIEIAGGKRVSFTALVWMLITADNAWGSSDYLHNNSVPVFFSPNTVHGIQLTFSEDIMTDFLGSNLVRLLDIVFATLLEILYGWVSCRSYGSGMI